MDSEYLKNLLSREQVRQVVKGLKKAGKKIVFTNGAFDILHRGHLEYLTYARKLGDILVVGLNTNSSIRRYKGDKRPVNSEEDRAIMLLGLKPVDYVVLFEEDEPADLIAQVLPDILIKGADWAHHVSGREIVEQNGGKVVLAKMVAGRSSSNVIEKIVQVYGKQ